MNQHTTLPVAPDTILRLDALHSGYGELPVLHGITLAVQRGQIFSVVGANGAGKTTLLLTISGHLPVRAGSVKFNGQDISRLVGPVTAKNPARPPIRRIGADNPAATSTPPPAPCNCRTRCITLRVMPGPSG